MFKDRTCPFLMLNNKHYKDSFRVTASESLFLGQQSPGLDCPGIAAKVSQHTNSSCSDRKLQSS